MEKSTGRGWFSMEYRFTHLTFHMKAYRILKDILPAFTYWTGKILSFPLSGIEKGNQNKKLERSIPETIARC